MLKVTCEQSETTGAHDTIASCELKRLSHYVMVLGERKKSRSVPYLEAPWKFFHGRPYYKHIESAQ